MVGRSDIKARILQVCVCCVPEVPSAWHLSKATARYDTDTFLSQELQTVVHVQLHCGIFFLYMYTYRRERHVMQGLWLLGMVPPSKGGEVWVWCHPQREGRSWVWCHPQREGRSGCGATLKGRRGLGVVPSSKGGEVWV